MALRSLLPSLLKQLLCCLPASIASNVLQKLGGIVQSSGDLAEIAERCGAVLPDNPQVNLFRIKDPTRHGPNISETTVLTANAKRNPRAEATMKIRTEHNQAEH